MPADYHTRIPLDSLFARLRGEGFEINTATILDVQKVLANLDQEDVDDIKTLPALLGPLICRNKEEQEKFYKICQQFFESVSRDVSTIKPVPKKFDTRKIILIAFAALAVILIAYFIFKKPSQPSTNNKDIVSNISITNSAGETEYAVNDPILFAANWQDSSNNTKYDYKWTIDGELHDQQQVEKVFSKPGTYLSSIDINDKKGNSIIHRVDSITVLCEKKPVARIVKDESRTSTQKTYTAEVTNSEGKSNSYSYLWYINDKFVSAQKILYSNYSPDSSYTIKLLVKWDSVVHCSADSLIATLNETPDIAMDLAGTVPLQVSQTTNFPNLLLVLGGLIILPSLTAFGVHRFFSKKRKKEREAELQRQKKEQQASTSDPSGSKEEKKYAGPYSIEFKSQDDKIFAESGISQLAETLRKRHSSDNYHLNVFKTIKQTIRSGGFPSLQFTPKTQPTDFLILLDKEYPDGHLTRLFNWVIGKLKKEEVLFTAYSFYKEPLLLNNESMNHHHLPIDKIMRLYPESIVLIFSGGNGFFESYQPLVKNRITQKFRNWETKLFFTPVAKNDWGSKELALYDAGFTVVPADINAHQIITDEINYMIDKQKLKKTIVPDAYGARQHNFNRWTRLENYLDKAAAEIQRTNGAFAGAAAIKKWVCALAVYPHINWNITLAIGKALEEKYCKPGQLVNYTNLLVLSRISWMNDGQVSDTLKKEMLVQLDKEAEAVARQAITTALQEIEPSISSNSLVNDEFIYLKTTNNFLLHTFNGNENELSQPEHLRMKEYVEKDQLDWVLDEYLSNVSNGTLLQKPGTTSSITPESYFEIYNERDESFLKAQDARKAEQERLRKAKAKRQKWIDFAKVAAAFFGIAIPLGLILNSQNIFTKINSTKPADIIFKLQPNPYYNTINDLELTIDTANFSADSISGGMFTVRNVPVRAGTNSATLNFAAGNSRFEFPIDTLQKEYAISFAGPANRPRLFVRYNIENSRSAQIIETLKRYYTVSAEQQTNTDSSRIIYYNPESKNRADSIAMFVQRSIPGNFPVIFIPENRTPPAPPMLFLNIDTSGQGITDPPSNMTFTNVAINSLPASLTEIWSGNTNNRFIRIEIAKRAIYYSTGNKNSYGRYTIQKVLMNGGNYKLITRGDKTFKVFMLRNIQPASFELSVCQLEYRSQVEAEAVESCDAFNRMSLYYTVDRNLIFVPLNTVNYVRSETSKINALGKSTRKETLLIQVNAQNIEAVRANRYTLIQQNNPLGKMNNIVWKNGEFNGTPFDRDFISNETGDKDPNEPNCNTVYYSMKEALAAGAAKVCKLNLSKEGLTTIPKDVFGFSNMQELDLGTVSIDESEIQQLQKALPKCKIEYQLLPKQQQQQQQQQQLAVDTTPIFIANIKFDQKENIISDQLYFLEKLGEYLKNYPVAKVRLRIAYNASMGLVRANGRLNEVRNILQKAGAQQIQISQTATPSRANRANPSSKQFQSQPYEQNLDQVSITGQGIDENNIKRLQQYLSAKAAN